eukprot:m.51720 g.51720  ORF g.51720 m.51720 type:complete len:59 (-) comp12645_c0_seq4:52-228(-)
MLTGLMKRSTALSIHCVHVCTVMNEQLYNIVLSNFASQMQRRLALVKYEEYVKGIARG